MSTQKLLVIGNGMAAGRAIETLLQHDPAHYDITILNAEPRVNYDRIMLSPVLAGEKCFEDIIIHDDAWYTGHAITLLKGCKATAIDRTAKSVQTADGKTHRYDTLILATGSAPFIIPVPGHALSGVITYRDLDDVNAMLKAAQKRGGRAVVIGGGLLGLEAAAGLKTQGMDVNVLHLMPTLMERQLDETAGRLLAQELGQRGITVITNANTRAILGVDAVQSIQLDDGSLIPADIVVMAAGIKPNIGLAEGAGLETSRGVCVDDHMRTSDPDIFAVGECAEHRGQCYGLVAPLYDMAQVLARQLAGDARARYTGSKAATKLKVTGIDLFSAGDFAAADGREEIVFHDPSHGIYRRLILQAGRLIGAVLYGDTTDGAWFFDLIQREVDVSDIRDTLMFGEAYQGGTPLGPMVAVAAWQDNLRRCNGHAKAA